MCVCVPSPFSSGPWTSSWVSFPPLPLSAHLHPCLSALDPLVAVLQLLVLCLHQFVAVGNTGLHFWQTISVFMTVAGGVYFTVQNGSLHTFQDVGGYIWYETFIL